MYGSPTKGRLLTAKAFEIGDVHIHSVGVSLFKHDCENHELGTTFRISIQPKSDTVELQLEQLRNYVLTNQP